MFSRIFDFRPHRALTGRWPARYKKLPIKDLDHGEGDEEDQTFADNISLTDPKGAVNLDRDSIHYLTQRLTRSILRNRLGLVYLALTAACSVVAIYFYRTSYQADLPTETVRTDKLLVMASFTKQAVDWTKNIPLGR